MTLFHSLHTPSALEKPLETSVEKMWPETYMAPFPPVDIGNYALNVRIENQHAKIIHLPELAALPTFNEARSIYSKAGWLYFGQWKGVVFSTLLNLFSTPHLYPWVKLETLNGQTYTMERQTLLNARLVFECDGSPLSVRHGGPVWMHRFETYLEYGTPHLKSIVLMQGNHEYSHPNQEKGFKKDQALIEPGRYYAVHQNHVVTLDRRGG